MRQTRQDSGNVRRLEASSYSALEMDSSSQSSVVVALHPDTFWENVIGLSSLNFESTRVSQQHVVIMSRGMAFILVLTLSMDDKSHAVSDNGTPCEVLLPELGD